MSNVTEFRYCQYWKKRPIGFLNANKKPLVIFEDIILFGGETYNPQGLVYNPKKVKRGNQAVSVGHDGGRLPTSEYTREYTNYPTQLLEFKGEKGLHPTQKPVALYEYLIRTYTNEGDTVLDFCMGSGTTGIACQNTGRNFVGIEKDETYFKIAQKRIQENA